ncbi:MAG: Methionine synthase I [Thermodesulfobacterium sp.]|uniref:Methionine synthase I n=1 Tax=Candidatus Thermodesulfobacterium syntrophicum TaxID=3060442 RepID=A0AAE3P2U1_9BACT|nr:Methionine synthase I [Candidatus Thermodesulfobacterium syntrophicum]
MGLTGIQILKKLPKTNCKECGFSTCMAFAMKVAAGQADINACPYVDPAVKEEIAEASAPPVKKVELGGGEYTYFLGGESVLFRHDKRFENPPLIGTFISTKMQEEEILRRIELYKKLKWERVGITLKPEILFLQDEENGGKLVEITRKVRSELPWVALVLASSETKILRESIEVCGDFKPLIYGASSQNFEELSKLSIETQAPLTIIGESLDEISELSEKALKKGLRKLVLDPGSQGVRELFEDLIIIRKTAVKNRFKPFGFPVITFPYRYTNSYLFEALIASALICKYSSIIILSDLKPEALFNLLVERMNIYTDPQKPLVVEEGIYPINGPDENSLVAITCNFALTYFIVNGEIEASRVPTWLLIKDTDGLSVLTAWAAGKFGADTIAPFIKKCGIEEKIKHKKLIIPGYLAGIKGELEEELLGWEIIVGPREASGIPAFFKNFTEELKKEKKTERIEVVEEEKQAVKKEKEKKEEGNHKVVCIAENINIMSKRIGKAIKERQAQPIQRMAKESAELGAEYLDLNIGPAKKDAQELAPWIVRIVEEVVDIPISLDTTNPDVMIAGLKASKQPSKVLINSITIHPERLNRLAPFAAETGCDVVALLWGESGLPRDANERASLAVDLVGKLNEYDIPNEKIWVDPVLTPITLGAQQIREILNFLSMLQEVTPGVKTIVGLSNVSNGVAPHLRPYLNRVMLMMLMKYNLYSAILDIYDKELIEIAKGKYPQWVSLVHKIMEGKEINTQKLSPKETEIYKTVKVLTGETIFSESWLEV